MSTGPRLLSGWQRDPDAFDPCRRIRRFEVDGRVFEASNLIPGWPMSIRPVPNPHLAHAMADWEDWPAAERAARECIRQESTR